jgi:hypothetical protein
MTNFHSLRFEEAQIAEFRACWDRAKVLEATGLRE